MKKQFLLKGKRLLLKTLTLSDVTKKYLDWLNDSDLQKYTRRNGKHTNLSGLRKFVKSSRSSDDYYFSIRIKANNKHIGNIFLNYVDKDNKSADLSIMIGDLQERGKGYAAEAIDLLSKFAFKDLKLHRLYAASPNPAFNKMIKKANWFFEGRNRDAFYLDGKYMDVECWSILEDNWKLKKK